MKQFANFKEKKLDKSVAQRLSPVTLSGVVMPWEKTLGDGSQFHFKLTCHSGAEYLIVESPEVRDELSRYCWMEVKIVGLLNNSSGTIIPQKVFPKGPDGESSNVIDLSLWKSQHLKRELLNRVNELVFVPTAVLTLLAS